MSPQRVGRMLKRLREDRELSQLEVAKRTRVSQGYLSALEAGQKKNPGIETLKKLARALGAPVTELLG